MLSRRDITDELVVKVTDAIREYNRAGPPVTFGPNYQAQGLDRMREAVRHALYSITEEAK